MRVLVFLLVLFSSSAFSADYYWYLGGTYGASPAEVCTARGETLGVKKADDLWTCQYKQPDGQGGWNILWETNVQRFGDACPAGTEFQSATGECKPPPPPPKECKVGELFPARIDGTVTSVDGKKYVNSGPSSSLTVCNDSCNFVGDGSSRPTQCFGDPADPTKGWCNYILKSDGTQCTANNARAASTGDALNPSDTPNVPDSSPGDDNLQCPKGWGVQGGVCFPKPPAPCDPAVVVNCQPDGTIGDPPTDGGGGGGGGGGGTAGGSSDSAVVDLENGKDAAAGDGSGNGTGTAGEGEACKPKADGTGCGGPAVKGEKCDEVMQCTGDAILCAQARFQKKEACNAEYTKESQDFVKKQLLHQDYITPTSVVDGADLFSAGTSASTWLPRGCPAPKTVSVAGRSISISYQPACDFASALGPLLVALAGLFFAVYVGRAFGGN